MVQACWGRSQTEAAGGGIGCWYTRATSVQADMTAPPWPSASSSSTARMLGRSCPSARSSPKTGPKPESRPPNVSSLCPVEHLALANPLLSPE
jgi:hypothetical protein